MSEMYLHFPKTNPIVFGTQHDYEPYFDAYRHEVRKNYCQQFTENDLISFQMELDDIPEFLALDIIVNGDAYEYSFLYHGGKYPYRYLMYNQIHPDIFCTFNDPPSNADMETWDGKRSGIICFSQKVKEIRLNGNRLIKEGDEFYFSVYANDAVFESNRLVCDNNTYKTKRIHYTHKGDESDYSFGTYFNQMPKGYDIRLHAEFLPLNQKASKEIFQTYKGGFDLVSAIPYETVKMQIGMKNAAGIPDWMLRNVNSIFHLNDKYIDGVAYELVEGSELETEVLSGYNPRMLSVEICRKEQEIWRDISTASAKVIPEIFTQYDNDSTRTTGKVTIVAPDRNFYLTSQNLDFLDYRFKESSTVSKAMEINFSTSMNLTNEQINTPVKMISLATGEEIGQFYLSRPPMTTGICNWKICDTFYIKC